MVDADVYTGHVGQLILPFSDGKKKKEGERESEREATLSSSHFQERQNQSIDYENGCRVYAG